MKLIGLDVGTTGCKAIVFNAEGHILGHGFREYGVICDVPGKAEQDAEQVWILVKEALREATAKSGGKDILAISLSVQGDAIIPVDTDFRALHPAILGMDYRSLRQAEQCEQVLGAFPLFARTGMRPHPINALTKVLLLREIDRAVFERAKKIVTYEDFILGKLGAEPAIDHTMASRTMAFDLASQCLITVSCKILRRKNFVIRGLSQFDAKKNFARVFAWVFARVFACVFCTV